MITCQMVPLPASREESLKTLLRSQACQTLREVAEAQVKQLQSKGLATALKVNPTTNKEFAMASELYEAQIYQHFLDVLEQFQRADKFELAKLS